MAEFRMMANDGASPGHGSESELRIRGKRHRLLGSAPMLAAMISCGCSDNGGPARNAGDRSGANRSGAFRIAWQIKTARASGRMAYLILFFMLRTAIKPSLRLAAMIILLPLTSHATKPKHKAARADVAWADTNHDGHLSEAEFQAAMKKLKKQEAALLRQKNKAR